MKQLIVTIGAAIAVLVSPAWAQKPATDHAGHHGTAQGKVALAEGEIRKVDKDAKKLTIKHGPMPALDMPPMTMVFQVKDPAMLETVKPGDKVKFEAQKLGGAYTVTRIEAAK